MSMKESYVFTCEKCQEHGLILQFMRVGILICTECQHIQDLNSEITCECKSCSK